MDAIENTISSARLERLEPSERDIELMRLVADGLLTTDEAVAIALSGG